MSATTPIAPPAVRWDLSFLFAGVDDPKIEQTWTEVLSRADAFAAKYRGKVASLSPAELASAVREIEWIAQESAKPGSYAQLIFTTDSTDAAIGAFMAAQMEKGSELSVKIMFFDLELQDLSDEAAQALLESPELAGYRHYLETVRRFRPHKLSEAEEIILEETANTGCRAWVRFFEETLAAHMFSFTAPTGEEEELTQEEVLDKLRSPDRAVRQAAADSLSAGLESLEHAITFTYNNLLQDKKVGDRLRKHPDATHSRHLANELDGETVDTVIAVCRENYPIVARYYRVKREILGLPELTHIDRYAPLFEAKEEVEWEKGRRIVVDAFASFSSDLARRADEFFTSQWIDAEPRKGKQGGAYCMSVTPDLHPLVFMNYQNKLDDVMTLAHELGHGVHASLSRAQSYVNFHGTLPLAELASTFGEMLVFESIVKEASAKDKLALYAEKIDGIFATIFRQAAMYQFEKRAHEARRAEGELTAEQFGDIWHEELQAMFGDAVTLGEQHRRWWSYIPHFFFAPFYVYAYSFGELLALSLYDKAKREGPDFVERYTRVLELGGSKSPHELMAIVGVDLRSRVFWEGGMAVLERLIGEFERLWLESKAEI